MSQNGVPKSTFGPPRAASSAPQNPPRPSFSPPGSSKVPSRSPRSSKHLLQGILGSLFIDFGWQNAPNGPQNGGLEPLKPPYSFQKPIQKPIQSTPSLNAVNHMGAAVSRSELNIYIYIYISAAPCFSRVSRRVRQQEKNKIHDLALATRLPRDRRTSPGAA